MIREHNLRGVNLQRFPYHFLFRVVGDVVRILVVRFAPQRRRAFQTHAGALERQEAARLRERRERRLCQDGPSNYRVSGRMFDKGRMERSEKLPTNKSLTPRLSRFKSAVSSTVSNSKARNRVLRERPAAQPHKLSASPLTESKIGSMAGCSQAKIIKEFISN